MKASLEEKTFKFVFDVYIDNKSKDRSRLLLTK